MTSIYLQNNVNIFLVSCGASSINIVRRFTLYNSINKAEAALHRLLIPVKCRSLKKTLLTMTYQKNVENSQSMKIHIGKGAIYQDLSMEINWKWPLKSWVHFPRTKSIISTWGLQAYRNRLLSRNPKNSCAKTELLQQIRWTEPRESTGHKRKQRRMAEPCFNLIRSAQEGATFPWFPKESNSTVWGLQAAKSLSHTHTQTYTQAEALQPSVWNILVPVPTAACPPHNCPCTNVIGIITCHLGHAGIKQ